MVNRDLASTVSEALEIYLPTLEIYHLNLDILIFVPEFCPKCHFLHDKILKFGQTNFHSSVTTAVVYFSQSR